MSLPLFPDDFPVSEAEVQNYLDHLPNLSALTSRREVYRLAYNVEYKIRALKSAGLWLNHPANTDSKTTF